MSDDGTSFSWDGHETWYQVVGAVDGASSKTPVVICHGGPGAAHDYVEPIAVVGQSWGGMLAMEYALDRPAGLRAIVVADSPASMRLWVSEADRLRRDLPEDVQETLTRHEQNGTTSDPQYETAVRVFYDRHLCRVPWPACSEVRKSHGGPVGGLRDDWLQFCNV